MRSDKLADSHARQSVGELRESNGSPHGLVTVAT